MDREKIIKGLECCTEWDSCNKCPYETSNEYDIAECTLSLHTDALALLKEQEAEIRQLRLALDIAKGTCKGISVEGR